MWPRLPGTEVLQNITVHVGQLDNFSAGGRSVKTFPFIRYSLEMCRQSEFYTMHFILPALIISTLALTSFIVHPESGDKVTMGITTMVTIVVFLTMVIPMIPPKGGSPLISKFFSAVLVLTTMITLLEAVITRMYRTARPLPVWLNNPAR